MSHLGYTRAQFYVCMQKHVFMRDMKRTFDASVSTRNKHECSNQKCILLLFIFTRDKRSSRTFIDVYCRALGAIRDEIPATDCLLRVTFYSSRLY